MPYRFKNIMVSNRCPYCGRFIRQGEVKESWLTGKLKFKGFTCSNCGEVKPDYWRVANEDKKKEAK